MKSIVLLAAAAAALVATGVAGADGVGPSATGGVHLTVHDVFGLQTLELQNFDFNAKLKADGSADGWYTYREIDDGVPYVFKGPVTCLTVIGQDAWIGGEIESSNDPTYAGLSAWWHVRDNGEGAGETSDLTTFAGVGTAEETVEFCAAHRSFRFPFPIDGGNVQVRS
jgi:hypothetical protein